MSVPPFVLLIRATASRHGTHDGRTSTRLGDAEALMLKSTMQKPIPPRYPADGQRPQIIKVPRGVCTEALVAPLKSHRLACSPDQRPSRHHALPMAIRNASATGIPAQAIHGIFHGMRMSVCPAFAAVDHRAAADAFTRIGAFIDAADDASAGTAGTSSWKNHVALCGVQKVGICASAAENA